MPQTADIVIIGGGPAGAGAAWALERAQPGIKIVLLEKNSQLASGSSTASLENFRTCWPAPCLARMMQRSREVFTNTENYLNGANIGVKTRGYLFCGFNEQDRARLRAEVQHLHNIGVDAIEFLDADEVHYRYPWLKGQVIAAKYDPTAGWLDSHALVYAFLRGTPTTTVLTDVHDVAIKVENGRVTGVQTPQTFIAAGNVLIAAGAESRRIGRTAGIEIPIVIIPRQSFTTPKRHADFPKDAPTLIGAPPFPHVRPEAREGAIFGWEYAWLDKQSGHDHLVEPEYPIFKDQRFPSVVLTLLSRQFNHAHGQGFADPVYLRGIDHRAGYYVYRDPASTYFTHQDGSLQHYHSQRAILDQWPTIEGLYLSVAHVGHGIMSSPAAGEIITSRILGLPLTDPTFADFGLNVPYVEHDSGGISGST